MERIEQMMKKGSIQKVVMKNGSQVLQFDVNVLLDEVIVQASIPEVIKQALSGSVTWQQRNETSLARFLAGSSQFPAFILALLVCDAVVQLDGGQGEMDLNNYLLSKKRQQAAALWIPVEVPGRKVAMAKIGLTPAGRGIVIAAAGLLIEDGTVNGARLALSGVWPNKHWLSTAADKLVAAPLSEDSIQAVVQALQEEVDPPSDYLGSAAYRRAMAGVLSRQVLEACG